MVGQKGCFRKLGSSAACLGDWGIQGALAIILFISKDIVPTCSEDLDKISLSPDDLTSV